MQGRRKVIHTNTTVLGLPDGKEVRWGVVKGKVSRIHGDGGDLTLGRKQTMQYTDDVP